MLRDRESACLESNELIYKRYTLGRFYDLTIREEYYQDPEENGIIMEVNDGEIIYDLRNLTDRPEKKILMEEPFFIHSRLGYPDENVRVYFLGEKNDRPLYLFILKTPQSIDNRQKEFGMKTKAYFELISPETKRFNPYIPFLVEDEKGQILLIEERLHQIITEPEILYKKEDRIIDFLTIFEEEIKELERRHFKNS